MIDNMKNNSDECAMKTYTDKEKDKLIDKVCDMMSTGVPCGKSCEKVGVPKSTFLGWTKAGGRAADRYALARDEMIHSLAEDVLLIADKDPVSVVDNNGIARYDSAAVQHQRLRVDSRKWLLSKMMPKVYGDKVAQEHSGVDGGPINIASLNLKNLTDEELSNMEQLIEKGNTEEQ